MINRKIDRFLDSFFDNNKKSLLITGARQIGKTFSIRQFGKRKFSHFVEINFIDAPEAVALFSNARNSQDLLLRLSAFTKKTLVKNETLIFFDEVQACPEIITAIKFLVEEGSYRYIMSGSLLGVEMKDLRSVPVGYMTIKEMYPIDFEEFIRAIGINEAIINTLRESFDKCQPVDEFVHSKIMDLFRLYLIVGGMPAAVTEYLNTNNLRNVSNIQKEIITLYKKDIGTYDPEHKLYIEEIFKLIPPELNAKNKRFILKRINENLKFSRFENSFLWLKEAGVALPVYNVDEPKIPLLLSRSRNLFKLFQNDVGMLACQYADGIQIRILNQEDNINFGAVFENFTAQELHAHGFDLYYFNSKKQGELDFLIEQHGEIVPVEIKSGKDYERHKALSNILSNKEYQIEKAYVFGNENVKSENNIHYLPMYMLMFLNNETTLPAEYRIDLSGLI